MCWYFMSWRLGLRLVDDGGPNDLRQTPIRSGRLNHSSFIAAVTRRHDSFDSNDRRRHRCLQRLHGLSNIHSPLTIIYFQTKTKQNCLSGTCVNQQMAMKLSPVGGGREAAMEAGLRQAIDVPLHLAKHVDAVWQTLVEMAAVGNINCKSDLQVRARVRCCCFNPKRQPCDQRVLFDQVAARCLKTAVQSARDNVIINLSNAHLKDETYKTETRQAIDRVAETARAQCRQVLDILEKRSQ